MNHLIVQEVENKYHNGKKDKEKEKETSKETSKERILMGCGCNKLCPKCRKNKNNCTCNK